MEKIASFKINHEKLLPGLYLSRRDNFGGADISTYDLRLTAPNREPPADQAALHTIEHLGATYLRNALPESVVYFGPMGCRTGLYLLLAGDKSPEEICPLIVKTCDYILSFEGEIPGAKSGECGNFREHNLTLAKYYIKKYRDALLNSPRFEYPD